MRNQTEITVIGNLTADPEMRFTANGTAVAKFTVAVTPRTLDRTSGQWSDGEPTFWPVTVWRTLAENVASSLGRGNQVIVAGRVRNETWEAKDSGEKRSRLVIDADAVGASLDYATVTVRKMTRGGSAGNGGDDTWDTASRTRPTAERPAETPTEASGSDGTGNASEAAETPTEVPAETRTGTGNGGRNETRATGQRTSTRKATGKAASGKASA